jgi:hypothetical protein
MKRDLETIQQSSTGSCDTMRSDEEPMQDLNTSFLERGK